jgi:hypothetical protein
MLSHYGLSWLQRQGIRDAFLLPDYIHSECGGADAGEEGI